MDVTAAAIDTPLGAEEGTGTPQSGDGVDAQDDFKREMHLYVVFSETVYVGVKKLVVVLNVVATD